MGALPRTLRALGTALIAIALVAGGAVWGCGGSSTRTSTEVSAPSPASLGGNTYSPSIDPSNFVSKVDNPYLPYKPGTVWRYRGVMKNGVTPQTDTVAVTHRTKQVMGVDCVVVRDTVTSKGRPVERTYDWYAQDRQGNVWYMGEETQELKHGQFGKMIDSGPAGRNGAKPGIMMEAAPKPGDRYWQFHWTGHALDKGTVLRTNQSVAVPYQSFSNALLTQEQSPLEPGIRDWKWSVPGIGYVKERAAKGSQEQIKLMKFTSPSAQG
jgi:hypothetical protein